MLQHSRTLFIPGFTKLWNQLKRSKDPKRAITTQNEPKRPKTSHNDPKTSQNNPEQPKYDQTDSISEQECRMTAVIIWEQLAYSHCLRRSCRQKNYKRRERQKRSVNGHMETGFYINCGLSRPILISRNHSSLMFLYLPNCYNV